MSLQGWEILVLPPSASKDAGAARALPPFAVSAVLEQFSHLL